MPHDRCPSPRLSVVPARRPAACDRRGNAASRSGGRRCRPARGHRAVQRVAGDPLDVPVQLPVGADGALGLARVHAGNPGESAVRAGLIVGTFAYGAWTVTVAFMGAAGASLAHSFTVADAGMTATRAVFLFDMIQPFALATQRVAGFALGLSTCLFAWGVSDGKVLPRWLATGGLAAGAVAMALALVFRKDTKADQAAFVLPMLWQLVTATVMLRPLGLRG